MQTSHTAEYIDGLMDVLIVLREYEVEIIPTEEGLLLTGDFINKYYWDADGFPLSCQPNGFMLSLHGEAGTDDDFDDLAKVLAWIESEKAEIEEEARKTAIIRFEERSLLGL